jgi:periplasmic copper chaperone A
MRRSVEAILLGAAISLVPAIAAAHVSITSGAGFANANQTLLFGVGHGCEGLDTTSVKIDIPADVTGVLPMSSDFGRISLERDAAGAIKTVTWTRAAQEAYEKDFVYWELGLRVKLPDKPFSTIFFPTHQYCQGPDGGVIVTDWIGTDPNSITEEPAPAVRVVPSRRSGWNKFTVPVAVADLGAYFSDALIVWKGSAAYSPNPATADLIKTTSGVTALTALGANDEIWVKY